MLLNWKLDDIKVRLFKIKKMQLLDELIYEWTPCYWKLHSECTKSGSHTGQHLFTTPRIRKKGGSLVGLI